MTLKPKFVLCLIWQLLQAYTTGCVKTIIPVVNKIAGHVPILIEGRNARNAALAALEKLPQEQK